MLFNCLHLMIKDDLLVVLLAGAAPVQHASIF